MGSCDDLDPLFEDILDELPGFKLEGRLLMWPCLTRAIFVARANISSTPSPVMALHYLY